MIETSQLIELPRGVRLPLDDCRRFLLVSRTTGCGRLRKFTIWATSGSALGIPRLHRYNVIVPWRGGRTPKEAPMGNADRAQGLGHRLRNSQAQT